MVEGRVTDSWVFLPSALENLKKKDQAYCKFFASVSPPGSKYGSNSWCLITGFRERGCEISRFLCPQIAIHSQREQLFMQVNKANLGSRWRSPPPSLGLYNVWLLQHFGVRSHREGAHPVALPLLGPVCLVFYISVYTVFFFCFFPPYRASGTLRRGLLFILLLPPLPSTVSAV